MVKTRKKHLGIRTNEAIRALLFDANLSEARVGRDVVILLRRAWLLGRIDAMEENLKSR